MLDCIQKENRISILNKNTSYFLYWTTFPIQSLSITTHPAQYCHVLLIRSRFTFPAPPLPLLSSLCTHNGLSASWFPFCSHKPPSFYTSNKQQRVKVDSHTVVGYFYTLNTHFHERKPSDGVYEVKQCIHSGRSMLK